MRILVTGKKGQLARSLAALAKDAAVDVLCLGRPELDLGDSASIDRAINGVKPDIVINTAAYTAVDQAETDELEAHAINAHGAGFTAAAAARINAPIIHVSTDYVFDGKTTGAYSETDSVAPTSVYGRSKLSGERAVIDANPHHIIVRTAWVISPYGKNFCKTMLRLAQDKAELEVVSDQTGSPTYAPHLAEALLNICKSITADPTKHHWGIFHIANTGCATWFDVAQAVMEAAKTQGLESANVRAISSEQYRMPVQRPANSCLDSNKARQTFGIALPHWRYAVELCVSALADNEGTPSSRRK